MVCFNINRFHFFALITWQFGLFFASQMLFPIFSNYVPRWRCLKPGINDSSFSKNCTIWEECGGKNKVEFEFNYFASAALEFDWICGMRSYWAHFYSQLQFIGVLIGTVIWGSLSDFFGRKPITLFVLSFGVLMNFASGVVPTWKWLLFTRFFIGTSIGGTVVVVCTYVMEMILPEQRMTLRAFFNWGTARLWVTLLCYIFPNWKSASLACAFCALPAPFIVLFVFPESPAWLHSKGRIEEMKNSEKHIAHFAGVKYIDVKRENPYIRESFLKLLRNPEVFRRVFVLWVMWFVASFCGYAMDLNSSNIVGNLFLNQMLFSILIASSKMFLVLYDTLQSSFSRRNLHQYAQFTVCICFFTLAILTSLKTNSVLILIINLIGTVFIEYTWDACYLCGVESVPTNFRATALGSCSFVARIGAVLAPTFAYFNSIWAPSAYVAVTIAGTICLIISYKYLIETKGVDLGFVKIDTTENTNIESNDVKKVPNKTFSTLISNKQ